MMSVVARLVFIFVVAIRKTTSQDDTQADSCRDSFGEVIDHPLTGKTSCRHNCYPMKPSTGRHQIFCRHNCPQYNRCVVESIIVPCISVDSPLVVDGNNTLCSAVCISDPSSQLCQKNCSVLFSCFTSKGWSKVGASVKLSTDIDKDVKRTTAYADCRGAAEETIQHPIRGSTKCKDNCPPVKSSNRHRSFCAENCFRYHWCIVQPVIMPCLHADRELTVENNVSCSIHCVHDPSGQMCRQNCSATLACYSERCRILETSISSGLTAVGGVCEVQTTLSSSDSNSVTRLNVTAEFREQRTTASSVTTDEEKENTVIVLVVVIVIVIAAVVTLFALIKKFKNRIQKSDWKKCIHRIRSNNEVETEMAERTPEPGEYDDYDETAMKGVSGQSNDQPTACVEHDVDSGHSFVPLLGCGRSLETARENIHLGRALQREICAVSPADETLRKTPLAY